MKINKGLISFGLLLLAGVSVATHADPASAKVQLGSFLTTRRAISVKNSKQKVTIKIPKGTTVQVDGFKNRNGIKYAYFNIEKLNYNVRKPLLNKSTSTISAWQKLTKANYKQIKKPTYLYYYSAIVRHQRRYNKIIQRNGSMWEGQRFPANFSSAHNARVRVTNDGYLEYYKSSPYLYMVSSKPTYSAKIINAKHEVAREYLTVKKGTDALPFDKLANGDSQIVIWWTAANTYTALPNENNAKQVISSNLYRLGNSKSNYWFMKSGTANLK